MLGTSVKAALLAAVVAVGGGSSALAAQSLRAAQLEDLRVAQQVYVDKTMALSRDARREALALLDRLRPRAGRMTRAEFILAMAELAAQADNGHDNMSFETLDARPQARAPFILLWFPDGLVIARAKGAAADLVGGRVLAIDGLSPDELFSRIRRYNGGLDAYRRWNLTWMLQAPEMLQALGVGTAPDRISVTVRLKDGRVVRRNLGTIPFSELPSSYGPVRYLSGEPVPGAEGWVSPIPPAADPLAFREGDKLFRTAPLPQLNALYVQFRINFTYEGQSIEDFAASTAAAIERDKPRNVVLDLRQNTGGDLTTTLSFMRKLAPGVPGRVYVLIGPYTFSAGIVAAAAVKKSAPARVVLVGEPVGDRLRFWSEGLSACLPNSHICLRPTYGMFDMVKGCKGEAGCYGDQWDVNVGDLTPRLRAPLTAEAWLAGRDPAMDAVAKDLARRR